MTRRVRITLAATCVSALGCFAGCGSDGPDDRIGSRRGSGHVLEVEKPLRERELPIVPSDLLSLGQVNGPEQIKLDLFDVGLELEIETVEVLSDTNVIVNAHAAGNKASAATLVVKDDAIVGTVTHDGRLYEIWSSVKGKVRVRELDPAASEKCDAPAAPYDSDEGAGPAQATSADDPQMDVTGSVLDLLVAYTPSALAQAGSKSAIEAAIQMAVNDTSITYANSGMTHGARLVQVVALSQAESGDFSSDLSAAKGTSDGKWDEIHALRTQTRADQVSVVIGGSGSGTLGIGYVGGGKAAAFTVTKLGAFSRMTFTHELGHNLGLRHEDDFESAAGRFRQVMAYGTYPRIKYHSNPNIVYGGIVMGSASYNSVAKLEKSIPAMESYFASATATPTPTPTATPTPTGGACGLTVVSPNGGEVIQRGKAHAIAWRGGAGETVRIRLQRVMSNGTITSTIGSRIDNDGSATWTPSTSLSPGRYKLIVVDGANSSCVDASDKTFTVQ